MTSPDNAPKPARRTTTEGTVLTNLPGAFDGHVKFTFGRGTSLTPVPPATPIGMGKASRGVDLASLDDIDEQQVASWMRQAAAMPGFGKR